MVRSAALRLAIAAVGLGLLGVLDGLGAGAVAPAAGEPPVTALVITFRVLLYLALALEVVIGAVLVYALWPHRRRGKRRPEDEWEQYQEPPRIHWAVKVASVVAPLALVAGLIVLALRTSHGGSAASAVPLPLGAGRPGLSAPVGAGSAGDETGLVALAIALGIVALVAAAAFLLLRRRHRGLLRPTPPARAVAAAVDDGLEALHGERDPRRAVVLAYAAMERALARRGWPRVDAEAPFEYLARVAVGMTVGATHLHGLTELFEVARFSEHAVDEAMRAAAVRHLESVRADLEVPPSTV